MRTCLPPGHRQLGEDPAAENLIIAGFRFRKNLGRMTDQHVQAIKNQVNVVLPCTTFVWAAPKTAREVYTAFTEAALDV